MRKDVLFPACQVFTAIGTFVLQYMADVFAAQKPKQSVSSSAEAGKLKIDKGGVTVFVDKNIGFLGQIIVDHTCAMNLSQQSCRRLEVAMPGRSCRLHGQTLNIAP